MKVSSWWAMIQRDMERVVWRTLVDRGEKLLDDPAACCYRPVR